MRSSSDVQLSHPLQRLLDNHFGKLVLNPVSGAGDHDRSNVLVRKDVFDEAKLVDRRIGDHDRHLPLVRYGVEVAEEIPWSVLLYGQKTRKRKSNQISTASVLHKKIEKQRGLLHSRQHV